MVPGGAGDGPARVGTAFAMRNTDRFDADILHVLGPDSSVAELWIVNPTVGGSIPSQGVTEHRLPQTGRRCEFDSRPVLRDR